jgi:hypothetical protein
MLTHMSIPNPVVGAQLDLGMLQRAMSCTDDNFNALARELFAMKYNYVKAMDFVEWLAKTNPQILDEFRAAANAVEKLEPKVPHATT